MLVLYLLKARRKKISREDVGNPRGKLNQVKSGQIRRVKKKGLDALFFFVIISGSVHFYLLKV